MQAIRRQRTKIARWAQVLLAAACCLQVAQCQFLQPQSHLGRLVQSITSPLVLSATGGYGGADSLDSDEAPGPAAASPSGPENTAQHFQHYQHYQPRQPRGQSDGEEATGEPARNGQRHAQAMQQAPSQERAIPQHFYAGRPQSQSQSSLDDEEAGAPSSPHKQRSAAQEYQMGAYLGPTIDDKEIQGAFNSKDDERDDDESAAGFMGPAHSEQAGRQRAASSYAPAPDSDAGGSGYGADSGYGPAGHAFGPLAGSSEAGSPYGPAAGSHSPGRGYAHESGHAAAPSASSFDDDESGADEDDEPAAPRGRAARRPNSPRFRTSAGSLNQAAAASQFHQRRQQQGRPGWNSNANSNQQLQAAANGYAPYGYATGAGPIDLSSLMAAAAAGGPAGPGGYEVYNGDGSYPGQGFYQQQGNNNNNNNQQARRNQAASSNMNDAGPYSNYNAGGRGDNDDQDSDNDDD